MKLLIVADYNDGDYSKDLIEVNDDTFSKYLPLIEAINNFKPYVAKSEYGDIVEHNWESPREDLGEKNLYETYPQFSKEIIDGFRNTFMSGLNNPEADYGGAFHTIITIEDVVTGTKYIDWDQTWEACEARYTDSVREYRRRLSEIYSYKRPSDGKPLNSIPFNEMTEYENSLIEMAHNLWREYQD